jgi:hypothetical protein
MLGEDQKTGLLYEVADHHGPRWRVKRPADNTIDADVGGGSLVGIGFLGRLGRLARTGAFRLLKGPSRQSDT